MIYYINDADGDTVLFEAKQNQYLDCDKIEKKVSPKRNRLLLFESDRFHTSSSPSENFRSVINFVFYGKEKEQSEWKKTFGK